MRNLFDRYSQSENRLSHTLASRLHEDRALLKGFLACVGVKPNGIAASLVVGEQSLPGDPSTTEKGAERKDLPDQDVPGALEPGHVRKVLGTVFRRHPLAATARSSGLRAWREAALCYRAAVGFGNRALNASRGSRRQLEWVPSDQSCCSEA